MLTKKLPSASTGGTVSIQFGDPDFYAAGSRIPEGNYMLTATLALNKPEKDPPGSEKLGVMWTAINLEDPSQAPRQQFMNFGKEAHKTYGINPATGTSLVLLPGAVATPFNDQTNWAYFLKSLYDCGMPRGIFSDDIAVLNGMWVHLSNIPEPEDRKNISRGVATGEAGVVEPRRNNTMPVVTEILPGGAPWDGGGGTPKAGAKPKANGKAPVTVLVTAPAKAGGPSDEDILEAAGAGANEVLSKSPAGVPKLLFKGNVKKFVIENYGDELGQAVEDNFYSNDEALGILLEQVGYVVAGAKIVPAT